MDYHIIMRNARSAMAWADEDDRKCGKPARVDYLLDSHLKVAIHKIMRGIQDDDWDCIADAQVMLLEIHERIEGTLT